MGFSYVWGSGQQLEDTIFFLYSHIQYLRCCWYDTVRNVQAPSQDKSDNRKEAFMRNYNTQEL